MAKGSDKLTYLLGIVILGFVVWKLIGYILPDKETFTDGGSLLNAVIEKSGGFEQWKTIKRLQFEKEFGLYTENGVTEIARKEIHDYLLQDAVERQIQWNQNNIETILRQKNNTYTKYLNNIIDSITTTESIKNSIEAGSFVIGLPFTLKDSDASLEYLGIQKFQDKQGHVLKIQFENSKDIWKLFYEKKSLNWLGYLVKTTDHYSLVINEKMTMINGFTFPEVRKSYRSDSLQHIKYLRADYSYSKYKVTFLK